MARAQEVHAFRDETGDWSLFAEGAEPARSLASSSLALPGFVVGWMGIGVIVGLGLAHRGHDRRLMVALGMGLGPIMLLVAVDAIRCREGETRPVVVDPGVHLGGALPVLVLVQGGTAAIESVAVSLDAIRSEMATLTLAQAVPYEWLDGDLCNDVVTRSSAALSVASERVPVTGARLEVHPGTPQAVARRFRARHQPSVVLFAVDDAVAGIAPGGDR